MAAITICSDFGAQKIKSDTVSTVSPSISHEVMGPDEYVQFHLKKKKKSQTIFQIGCTTLKSHQQCVRILVAPCPQQNLVLSVFWTWTTILIDV